MSSDTEKKHEEEVTELKRWYHTVNALRIASIVASALVVVYSWTERSDEETALLRQYLFVVTAMPIILCLLYSACIQWGHYDMYWMSAVMGLFEAGFSLYFVGMWATDKQFHHTGLQLVAMGFHAMCTFLLAPTTADTAGHLYQLCKEPQEEKKSR